MEMLRAEQSERMVCAARSWLEGVGPPGKVAARYRRSSWKSSREREWEAAASSLVGRECDQARPRLWELMAGLQGMVFCLVGAEEGSLEGGFSFVVGGEM